MTQSKNHNETELILGSSSKSRRQVLAQIGLKLKQIAPDIDETPSLEELPQDLVTRLGKEKAVAVSKLAPIQSLIITGDQVLLCDNKIFGKPLTTSNAIAQLKFFSDKRATFFTNICLMNNNTKNIQTKTITTQIQFKKLSQQKIHDYIELESPLHCAGSLKIEGLGITLINQISSHDPHAVLGMPLMHLCSMLEQEKYDVFYGNRISSK
jgi:MAF protein